MKELNYILSKNNKNLKGLGNELLISGNLHSKGYDTIVLNDHNPNYDIQITKDQKSNFIECKLDTRSYSTNNFYFEYWNYTYNRPTGINNKNLNTLYCHTFFYNGEWSYIINKRSVFINTLKTILSQQPEKMRSYNNTYFINGKLVGDKAYLVDVATFFKFYKGKSHKLQLSLKWK